MLRITTSVIGLGLLSLTAGSPMPQGVTAVIAPAGRPSGCVTNMLTPFGIYVEEPAQDLALPEDHRRHVTQVPDGQLQAPTGHPTPHPIISPHSNSHLNPDSSSYDQGFCHRNSSGCPSPTSAHSRQPLSQINDGQPQAPLSNSAHGCSASYGVSQISDGQIQAPTGHPAPSEVTQINDGQIQAPPTYPKSGSSSNEYQQGESCIGESVWKSGSVTQTNDGQIQAPRPPLNACSGSQRCSCGGSSTCATSPAGGSPLYPLVTQINDGQIQATVAPIRRDLPLVHVRQPALLLSLTLQNGTLTDGMGRTGYIAANRQFQFDRPAQTGAIYTSGFSVCQDGLLALGNSKNFYRCRSGSFYNLYDQNIAPQCESIGLHVINMA